VQGHDKRVAFAIGILVLVADDDRVTPRQASRDRRVALQQCCGFNSEVVVAIGVVPSPGRGVRRKTDTGVVRIGDPGKGLIVGDPVKVAIENDELILLNPDGREMKMKITKRARAQ